MRYPESNWMHKAHVKPVAALACAATEEANSGNAEIYCTRRRPTTLTARVVRRTVLCRICAAPFTTPSSSWKACWMLLNRVRRNSRSISIWMGMRKWFLQNGCAAGGYSGRTAARATVRIRCLSPEPQFCRHFVHAAGTLSSQGACAAGRTAQGEGIANPHERVNLKHEITQQDMQIDEQQKLMFIDLWLERRRRGQTMFTLQQGIRA